MSEREDQRKGRKGWKSILIKRDQVHKPDSTIKNIVKEVIVYVYMIVCVCQKERKREEVE